MSPQYYIKAHVGIWLSYTTRMIHAIGERRCVTTVMMVAVAEVGSFIVRDVADVVT